MKESQFYGATLSVHVNAARRIPEMIGSFETDLRQIVSKHGDKWPSRTSSIPPLLSIPPFDDGPVGGFRDNRGGDSGLSSFSFSAAAPRALRSFIIIQGPHSDVLWDDQE